MAPPNLSDLAGELICLIAENCGQTEMSRLARTNTRLRNFITPKLYKRNIRDKNGSAMFLAARNGNLDTLELLKTAGAEWNDQSASYSDEKVRRAFSPNLPRQHPLDIYFSPLHIAAKFGQYDAVRWLMYVFPQKAPKIRPEKKGTSRLQIVTRLTDNL